MRKLVFILGLIAFIGLLAFLLFFTQGLTVNDSDNNIVKDNNNDNPALEMNNNIQSLLDELTNQFNGFASYLLENIDNRAAVVKKHEELSSNAQIIRDTFDTIEVVEGGEQFYSDAKALMNFYLGIINNEYVDFIEVVFNNDLNVVDIEKAGTILQNLEEEEEAYYSDFQNSQNKFAEQKGFIL